MSEDIRLLLVDDEWLVRAGLRTMLTGQPDISIVGEAADGSTIADLVRETGANLILMDVRMPRVNGLAATEVVRALPDPPHVVMLTTFDNDNLILRALRSGATGYLLKDTPPPELIAALRKVIAGEPIFSPTVLRNLVRRFSEPSESRAPAAQLQKLTAQEQRVATAVARGLANAEIASELLVSVATVKTHLSHIFEKLQVSNRVQVALLLHDIHGEKSPER